ncbi:MAG TPA: hypothetical protein VMZ92_12405 [Planctomycetota bacterium]|nr:hypothetical protein [Planctomycetota bacterium]
MTISESLIVLNFLARYEWLALACLGVAAVCALACPVYCISLFSTKWRTAAADRGWDAIFAGVSAALGIACSLPFGQTRELPLLPFIAIAYFGGIVLSTILYGLWRASKR